MPDSILVIKLGALGDFIQALGPIETIRKHHKSQIITLLTTKPFIQIAKKTNLVDHVWEDTRPSKFNIHRWLFLRKKLRTSNFIRVYDLQTSQRSSLYFHMFWPGPYPEWSGIANGCSHPHHNLMRDNMHTIKRQSEQLRHAGIKKMYDHNFSWVKKEFKKFTLPEKYALIVPGANINRPEKRWAPSKYGLIAAFLKRRKVQPVIIGISAENSLAQSILEIEPDTIDLTGKTNLNDLFFIFKNATLAVGNDTGPMHISAALGCASIVIFSEYSNPSLCAPRGNFVKVIQRTRLDELEVDDVLKTLEEVFDNKILNNYGR